MFYRQWVSIYGGIYTVQLDKIGGSGCPDTQDTPGGIGPAISISCLVHFALLHMFLSFLWYQKQRKKLRENFRVERLQVASQSLVNPIILNAHYSLKNSMYSNNYMYSYQFIQV